MRRALLIAGREVRLSLRSPSTWVFLAALSFLAGLLVFVLGDFFAMGRAELRPLFDLLPWLLAFFLPSLTMRMIAEEERAGTLELLLTAPFSEGEIVAGKILGACSISLLAIAATVPIAAVVFSVGSPDIGPAATGYLGVLCLAFVFTSLGLAASARFASPVGAYVAGGLGSLLLLLFDLDQFQRLVPLFAREGVRFLSPLGRYASLSRGVVSPGDIAVLAAWGFFFLGLAALSLRARRGEREGESGGDRIATGLFLGTALALAAALAGFLPARFDATAEGRYTLSPVGARTLANLPDGILLRVYLSRDNPPPELVPMIRDLSDLLAEMRRLSGGKLRYEILDPGSDEQAARDAARLGIPGRSVGIVSNEEYKEVKVYAGLAAFSAGAMEPLPFLDGARLEYQIIHLLRRLTGADRPVVLFAGGGGHSLYGDYALFREVVGQTVEIRQYYPGEPGAETKIAAARAVVVADPALLDTDLVRYVERGGSLLLLAGTAPQSPLDIGSPEKDLARWGIRILSGTVLDASCEVVQVPRGSEDRPTLVPVPFPALVRVTPEGIGAHPFTKGLSTMLLPWATPVMTTEPLPPGVKVTTLVSSSPRSQLYPAPPILTDPLEVPEAGMPYPLAVLVEGIGSGGGKVILLGSHLSLSMNLFADPSWMEPNLVAAESFLDGLVTGGEFLSLRAKEGVEHPFTRAYTPAEKSWRKWTGTLAGPVAVAIWATFYFLWLRRDRSVL